MDVIKCIFDLYEKYGNEKYIGENITQLEHAIQTAEYAEKLGYDNEMILSCFLHDIGHLLGYYNKDRMFVNNEDFGVTDHENIGANYLERLGFSKKITEPIRQHVNSKRYLVTINSIYFNNLSNASKNSLKCQGNKMNDIELHEFQNNQHFERCLMLRKCDDEGKKDIKSQSYKKYVNLCKIILNK